MATSRAKKHYQVTPADWEGEYSTTLWAESEDDAATIGRLLLGLRPDQAVAVGTLQWKEKGNGN